MKRPGKAGKADFSFNMILTEGIKKLTIRQGGFKIP
jgi:hypothetical protein